MKTRPVKSAKVTAKGLEIQRDGCVLKVYPLNASVRAALLASLAPKAKAKATAAPKGKGKGKDEQTTAAQ